MGLGNPGPRYAGTRHNVGFRVVEAYAERHGLAFPPPGLLSRLLPALFPPHAAEGRRLACGEVAGARVGVLEPLQYMNRSGEAVAEAVAANAGLDPARDLLVVYDDLDLPLGRLRLRMGGGAGGHRGLGSVIDELGTQDVPRLRFGIGRPPAGGDVVGFVLEPFDDADGERLASRIGVAAEAVACFVSDGIAAAMDRFNAQEATAAPGA